MRKAVIKILSIVLVCLVVASPIIFTNFTDSSANTVYAATAKTTTKTTTKSTKSKTTDLNKLKKLIAKEKKNVKSYKSKMNSAKKKMKSYSKNSAEYKKYQKQYNSYNKKKKQSESNIKYYQNRYNKFKRYPVATAVWTKLKNNGLSDVVTAAIIGNMMAEVGGQTLNLNARYYDYTYYGLCCWSTYYSSSVVGADVNGQINYLMRTMPSEFNCYGSNYYYGFNYSKFLKMKNVREAAIAFAASYERCYSGSYYVRAQNAQTAYNYYTK